MLPRNPEEERLRHGATGCTEAGGQNASKLASVSTGVGTDAGMLLASMYVGNGVSGATPGVCGLKAEAWLRRVCTGKSRLRVPT